MKAVPQVERRWPRLIGKNTLPNWITLMCLIDVRFVDLLDYFNVAGDVGIVMKPVKLGKSPMVTLNKWGRGGGEGGLL